MERFNEALKENQERIRQEKIKRNEEARKQLKKEKILTGIIAVFIVAISMAALYGLNKDGMERCVNSGHSVNYCEKAM